MAFKFMSLLKTHLTCLKNMHLLEFFYFMSGNFNFSLFMTKLLMGCLHFWRQFLELTLGRFDPGRTGFKPYSAIKTPPLSLILHLQGFSKDKIVSPFCSFFTHQEACQLITGINCFNCSTDFFMWKSSRCIQVNLHDC